MNLNLENITFVIVTFKSEKIINDCLETLPKESKIIVIENSKNINLKKDLEAKYDNIEVIISNNNGMGSSNNIGLKACKTKFAYVINPDVKFKKNTLSNIFESAKLIKDFTILSPFNGNEKFPNYLIKNSYKNINEDIIDVDQIDGFSMLINLEKFQDNLYFDENIFLYLENDDLCLRIKKKNENIYLIRNSIIEHLGSSSSDNLLSKELEYSRNWHWMWSKYYYNKKHYGHSVALTSISLNFFSGIFKYLIYLLIFNDYKKKIYKMRIFGIINAILNRPSWYRPKVDI
tara:strand:+ start:560 stop:1426 length:867 start_codon:yes stop_codon:yes gene_type:complete